MSMFISRKFYSLSWNIRGAVNEGACLQVFDFTHYPDILIVRETHVPLARVWESWKRLGFDSFANIDPDGQSGGLWVFWNAALVAVSIVSYTSQFINFSVELDGNCWLCSAIYATPSVAKRAELRDYLKEVVGSW